MEKLNRRDFMKKSVLTGAAISVVPGYVLGRSGYVPPSDKIRLGLIGTGNRMGELAETFFNQADCSVLAICDVDKSKLTKFAEKFSFKGDSYGDYRRILERKDIDAVVVATPDHWHGPIAVEACEAGKDVYLEKPISNLIPAGVKVMDAAKRTNRIVQLGTHQRSWTEFQECSKLIQEGIIGDINQVVVNHSMGGGFGGSRQQPTGPEAIPEGLDWEMWQGPAPRHPYSSARISWRNWFDYGGGSITDWGVHHIDIVHMAMGCNAEGPTFTAAATMPNTSPDLVPNTYSINYKYDDFIMSFVSCVQPGDNAQGVFTGGPSFFGSKGYAVVNRSGYLIRPPASMGFGRQQPTFEAINNMKPYETAKESGARTAHERNWLDCVKSRQKPICDAETGFYSSLPCLLGLQSIQDGCALIWDPKTKTVKKA